jgi:hypothetical protein
MLGIMENCYAGILSSKASQVDGLTIMHCALLGPVLGRRRFGERGVSTPRWLKASGACQRPGGTSNRGVNTPRSPVSFTLLHSVNNGAPKERFESVIECYTLAYCYEPLQIGLVRI